MSEEKIGMYTAEEIYEELANGFLHHSMVDAMYFKIKDLQQKVEQLEKENKILKDTILKALEFINNHTYRWKDTQFGEMVEVEDFEPGLKPIELINILQNIFENK